MLILWQYFAIIAEQTNFEVGEYRSSAGTLRAARNLRHQKKIYAIAVNGVSAIDEIAKIARTNYKNTIRWLKSIIKAANSKMNWHFLLMPELILKPTKS